MIMTAEPLDLAPGKYSFTFRMKSKAKGNGQFFSRPESRGYVPGSGTAFPIQHDDAWHIYKIDLKTAYPIREFRLDPATGDGEQEISWFRLTDQNGNEAAKWSFE